MGCYAVMQTLAEKLQEFSVPLSQSTCQSRLAPARVFAASEDSPQVAAPKQYSKHEIAGPLTIALCGNRKPSAASKANETRHEWEVSMGGALFSEPQTFILLCGGRCIPWEYCMALDMMCRLHMEPSTFCFARPRQHPGPANAGICVGRTPAILK